MRALSTALLLLLGTAAAAAPHPFTVQDLLAMDRVGAPALSPNGQWLAFTVSTTDLAANRRRSHLWLARTDGSGLRRLTAHADGSDSSPQWGPESRTVFFLSGRGGSSQVWRIDVDGGEASRVTELPLDVNAFRVSPDGRDLIVALEVFPECAELACTEKRLAAEKEKRASGRIYDRVMVRHWDTWKDGRRSHLFLVSALDGSGAVDLMRGLDADCPTKPFGGEEEFVFAPGGSAVVFAAKDAGKEEAWSTNVDLWVVGTKGKAEPRRLTAANRAWDTQPIFSPDGKTLAYLAMAVPGYEADRFRITTLPWPPGKAAPRSLSEGWDRSPDAIAWSADGRSILATADNLGQHSLFAVDAAGGTVRTLVRDGAARAPVGGAKENFFLLESMRMPAEVFAVGLDGTGLRPVTQVNAAQLSQVELGEPQQFTFKGWRDEIVHGYVIKPARFNPKQKVPVALLLHGGPQGSFLNSFHYRWNPQVYAGAGYGVVMIDFHGSTGYGQAFTDSIQGDWGGKPLEDVQRGLGQTLGDNAWMDSGRVCALGASYGGYLVNWIAGAWPDRFNCLVSHDGNLDERAAYFQTEELWFPERDHQGTPWDNPDGYEKHNPVNLVKNWKTPMLVIHGARDFRVVETQGLATFNALQRRGIRSKLLYFPDENHWVLRPHNSIQWHETVLDWLAEHLRRKR